MRYKVGDKVKVRSDLENGRLYGEYMIDNDMLRLSGKVITITRVYSDSYQIMEDGGDYRWTDKMFKGLAEGECIYAYELMKLAAEDPEPYKGKKYKVAKGNCMNGHGNKPMAVLVRPSGILADESTYQIYVTSETILEEIKPAPQPAPFTEAVKAYNEGKTIRCEINGFYKTFSPYGRKNTPIRLFYDEIQHGTWYIKEG